MSSYLHRGARLGLVALALAAGLWGLGAMKGRAEAGADLDVIATRILKNKPYSNERLQELAAAAATRSGCRNSFAESVIQLRLFEQAAADAASADRRMELEKSMSDLARCNPNEGFFPVVEAALALSDGNTSGFHRALEKSYRNAPRENWIALRRSGIALSRFAELPPVLQDRAMDEFGNMINSGMNGPAADIFVGLDAETRGQLIASLFERAAPDRRVSFFNTLLADRKKPRKSSVSRKLIENFSLPSGTSLDPVPAD